MFRVFRKFRAAALSEKNAMKYLRYALGEIALIVVGILIALQISNWNEARIEQREIRALALDLSAAIERDLAMLDPVAMQIRATLRQAEELADYLRDRPIEAITNVDLFFLSSLSGYRPYAWNRAALEQLKAAGGLRKMRNKQLAQRISDYDALTVHLDQDYLDDVEAMQALWGLLGQLIDTNYPPDGLEDVLDWPDGFDEADIERRVAGFRSTEVYRRLAADDRSLLSADLDDFRRLANLGRDYHDNTRWRTESEIPRLRGFAAEIQAMIEQEYGRPES